MSSWVKFDFESGSFVLFESAAGAVSPACCARGPCRQCGGPVPFLNCMPALPQLCCVDFTKFYILKVKFRMFFMRLCLPMTAKNHEKFYGNWCARF